jgi:hypothetical protein
MPDVADDPHVATDGLSQSPFYRTSELDLRVLAADDRACFRRSLRRAPRAQVEQCAA